MILVDYREKPQNQLKVPELVTKLKALNVPVEVADLPYGDVAFEGKGPDNSTLSFGIEHKTLHDMLHCIDDARYNTQRAGMRSMYDVSILMLEGHWKPHDPQGILMEGFSGGFSWGFCKYRTQRVMYSKLKRYLITVAMSGVTVDYTRDLVQTAYNVHEWYQWAQKRDHTSLLQIQTINIPTLNTRPSLTRLWANDIEGIGVKLSADAERLFKVPLRLAKSDEQDWLKIPGIGVKTAQQIVRQIWGVRK